MRNTEKKKKGLSTFVSSDYLVAADKLRGKTAKRRIVVYVEGYDDILFWRMVLNDFENEERYFEIMLPSRDTLNKGKKQALLTLLQHGAGKNMIACVDADYDYLMQGASYFSEFMLNNPYVVHTYAYAIENYQCYAPSLHNVCVMTTLNDHRIFDFEAFLRAYSIAIFPLFVWSIMLYRKREYCHFSITDFNAVVTLKHTRMDEVGTAITKLHGKVKQKVHELQKACPGRKEEYLKTKESLISLGVKPEETYLYIQGHHLFDCIVMPIMQVVCDELRREREREIREKALHIIQLQNELSSYQRSQCDIQTMMKKNNAYTRSSLYQLIKRDIERIINPQRPTSS